MTQCYQHTEVGTLFCIIHFHSKLETAITGTRFTRKSIIYPFGKYDLRRRWLIGKDMTGYSDRLQQLSHPVRIWAAIDGPIWNVALQGKLRVIYG